MVLKQAFAPLLDLVFPPRCPLCGAGVSDHNGLCAGCWGGLEAPGEPACGLCQLPLGLAGHGADEGEEGLCGTCRDAAPLHDGVHAATVYNRTSRRLVLALKSGGRIALAPMLGRLMAARLAEVDSRWLVVPVPLHRWRIWTRGYNQSALLAREIAHLRGARLLVDALVRHRRTPSLGGLGSAERARVLDRAIGVRGGCAAVLKGARVVLVDDVLTSGATTNACIAALRAAGAAEIRIACFARVTADHMPLDDEEI